METQMQAKQGDPPRLNPPTFQDSREAFLLRCRAQNLSRLTIGWYKGILEALGRFLEAHGIENPRDATQALLREHLAGLRSSGHNPGTVFRTYGALRCFFAFLARERMIPASPMSLVEKRGRVRGPRPAGTSPD